MSLRSVVAAGAKVSPPGWLCDNLCYETMMGSVAYGVSAETQPSDALGRVVTKFIPIRRGWLDDC